MKDTFFPKATISGLTMTLNREAVETMDFDVEGSKAIMVINKFPDKPKTPDELLIIKTNGSLCDDVENIKDSFDPSLIRDVVLTLSEDKELTGATITLSEGTITAIKTVMGDYDEFKLIPCNVETSLAKNMKEQCGFVGSYYRFVYVKDKRSSIGKEKVFGTPATEEERVSI
jgi:hypothetical protein